MKFGIAILIFLTTLSATSKEFAIEDTFTVDLPDNSISTPRSGDSIQNIGYPKLHNSDFQFMTYWWDWVQADVDLGDVPKLWEARRENRDKQISNLQPFETDSGLSGIRFKTHIDRKDRPAFISEMLLLRDPKGKVVLFQMAGDPSITESAFRSLRYKDVEQGAAANP